MFFLLSPCYKTRKTHGLSCIPGLVRKYNASSVLFRPKVPFHVSEHDLDKVFTGLWERAGGIKRPPSVNVTTFNILHTNQELLHDLQKACGYGFVSKKPDMQRNMYTFTVSKRTDIVKVLELLHGNIRHEPKRLSVERVMAQIKASSPKTAFLSPPQKSVVKTIADPGWLTGYNSLGGKTYVDHALPLEQLSHVRVGMNETSRKTLVDVQNRIDALTVQEFAHYLAGLIDSDGHIEKNGAVQISFHLHDVALPYAIQRRIGHGVVDLVKATRTTVSPKELFETVHANKVWCILHGWSRAVCIIRSMLLNWNPDCLHVHMLIAKWRGMAHRHPFWHHSKAIGLRGSRKVMVVF